MRKLEFMIMVHLVMYAAMVLNIAILRQIIVFVYLSFIPGFLLLKILKLKGFDVTETILFSVGLSMAFLMFFGLLISESYLIGVSRPLSAIPLTIFLGFVTLTLCVVVYRQDLSKDFGLWDSYWNKLRELVPRSAIFVLPIALGVVGGLFVNIPILLLLVVVICVLYALSARARLVPAQLYPLMIFTISLALLFHVVLTSKYIVGFDANFEFYVFKLTRISGHWGPLNQAINPTIALDYNSLLSVTLLPTIYSAMVNISDDIVFKIFYPFVFALVPVLLYQLYKRQVGQRTSLFSVLFFVSNLLVFYGVTPLSLNRQIVAEFFFVLSIFILLDKKMSVSKRRLLLVIFGAALVVSHYSLTYLYLAYVLFLVYAVIRGESSEVLDSKVVLSLFGITLAWYSFCGSAPLNSLADFFNSFFSRFATDISRMSARTSGTLLSQPISNIINGISLAIFVIVHFFLAIGILGLIFSHSRERLDPRYRLISIFSAIVMVLCFAVPNFAPSLELSRFYAITLAVSAPFFVLGFDTFLALSERIWRKVAGQRISRSGYLPAGTFILCTLLICFLLTQSGFINRVTGNSPLVRSLDLDRLETSNSLPVMISFHDAYIQEKDVFSAVWLSHHQGSLSTIYADFLSGHRVLVSYGLISLQLIHPLTNSTILEQNSLMFLSLLNVKSGVISSEGAGSFNLTEISPVLSESNQVYSNGDGIVCVGTPR